MVREAQAAAKLSHHHILAVFEIIEEPDRTSLITEYIQGKTLREHYQDRDLSDSDILEAGVQLCRALEHAHKRGVVHRDIKPENIMLVDGDSIDVRLMDFGVAQLEDRASITLDGDLVGTLAYMSPEQGEGKQVDSRSDVYSLALTLYEGFTGKSPFRGKKLQELLRDVSRPDIPPLEAGRSDLPQVLSDALARAMARDRYSRPDAATLGRQLGQAAKVMPEPSAYETFATRVRQRIAGPRADRDRLAYLGSHMAAGGFALCSLIYLLPRAPFYPQVAILPLVAVPTFLALMWPFAGGVLALAVLAPPIFAYGAGWGIVYAVPAIGVMALLRWRRRESAALLPGAIPLAVTGWVGLGVAASRRGPPAPSGPSRWILQRSRPRHHRRPCGMGLLPYAFTPGPGPVLQRCAHASSPWSGAHRDREIP